MYRYIARQVVNFCSTVCERNSDYLDAKHQSCIINSALQCLEQCMQKHGIEINNKNLAITYCSLQFAGEKNEIFGCLFLDSKNRVISFEKLFFGTINSAPVHPRVVLQRALAVNAAGVICTHNHVTGDTEPSRADWGVSRRLKEALTLVDVRLLDHIIVGCGRVMSLAELGCLS